MTDEQRRDRAAEAEDGTVGHGGLGLRRLGGGTLRALMGVRHLPAILTWVGLLAVGSGVVYGWGRARLSGWVYRDRLERLADDYERLHAQYAEAVRRTAVTEVWVRDGTVSVVVATADGDRVVHETPFRADREIYVDYVVRDGRVWIRRVFDERTPPRQAVVVDPSLGTVDWERADAAYGKAVYRRLEEGCWVVTVTGNGALGLEKRSEKGSPPLVHAPPVRSFSEEDREIREALRKVSWWDVVRALGRRPGEA